MTVTNNGTLPTAFVKLTEELELLLRAVPNAARLLYGWMRRQARPGTPIEICLSHFANASHFSLKWVKKSFDALVSLGLVLVIQEYGARWAKVAIFESLDHNIPNLNASNFGNKTSNFRNSPSNFGNKTSKKQPSNPCPTVPITENSENNKPEFCELCFSENVSNSKITQEQSDQTGNDQSDQTQSDQLDQIEKAIDQPIPPSLRKLVLTKTLNVITDAIAAMQQAAASARGVKDKVAFLFRAIDQEYKPRKSQADTGIAETTNSNSTSKVFSQWFDWARSQGHVAASTICDSQHLVLHRDEWFKVDEVMAMFPMKSE